MDFRSLLSGNLGDMPVTGEVEARRYQLNELARRQKLADMQLAEAERDREIRSQIQAVGRMRELTPDQRLNEIMTIDSLKYGPAFAAAQREGRIADMNERKLQDEEKGRILADGSAQAMALLQLPESEWAGRWPSIVPAMKAVGLTDEQAQAPNKALVRFFALRGVAPEKQAEIVQKWLDEDRKAKEFGWKESDRPLQVRKLTAETTGAEADAETKGIQLGQYKEFGMPKGEFERNAAQKLRDLSREKFQQQQLALRKREVEASVASSLRSGANGQMTAEGQLRDDYRTESKNWNVVKPAYEKIKASSASANGAGDMSMVYGIMKMLDPGSTVREGEYANAAQVGGAAARFLNTYNSLIAGDKLSPEARKQILAEAEKVYVVEKTNQERIDNFYRGLSERYKLNPQNVMTDYGSRPTHRFNPATGKLEVVP
jgi:hypothetical protein